MRLLQIVLLVIVIAGCKAGSSAPQNKAGSLDAALSEFKKSTRVEGLAFAIFTRDSVIKRQCIGVSSYGFPINDSTLFSIQSVSKNFTAMAVMMAVQDGLLDTETPLSAFLPGFSINSCFSEDPLNEITLAMLLSHTAGLTH